MFICCTEYTFFLSVALYDNPFKKLRKCLYHEECRVLGNIPEDAFFIVTAVKTSNLAYLMLLLTFAGGKYHLCLYKLTVPQFILLWTSYVNITTC
jgi:hypothetical protein